MDGTSSTASLAQSGFDSAAVPVEWLVPTMAMTVPGLLLMAAVLAQAFGALAWVPFVRRWLGRLRRPAPSSADRDRPLIGSLVSCVAERWPSG